MKKEALILAEKHKGISSKVYSKKICRNFYLLRVRIEDTYEKSGITITACDLMDLILAAQYQLDLYKSELTYQGVL